MRCPPCARKNSRRRCLRVDLCLRKPPALVGNRSYGGSYGIELLQGFAFGGRHSVDFEHRKQALSRSCSFHAYVVHVRRVFCNGERRTPLTFHYENAETKKLDIAAFHQGKVEMITDGLTDWETELNEAAAKTRKRAASLANIDPPTMSRAISDGNIDNEEIGEDHKAIREKSFPINVISSGLVARLQSAGISVEKDRIHILNCIAGKDLDSVPDDEHPNYERVNLKLRSRFAIAAWRQAVESGMVQRMRLPQVLAADTFRSKLSLNLKGCSHLNDSGVAALGDAFPQSLNTIDLTFDGCQYITDRGLSYLASKFPEGLTKLQIRLRGCRRVGDGTLASIGNYMPLNLRAVELRAGNCSITNAGMAAWGKCLSNRPSLVTLWFGCGWCRDIGDKGLAAFADGVQKLDNLKQLNLYLAGTCVGNNGLSYLGERLPASLKGFNLRVAKTMVKNETAELLDVDTLAEPISNSTSSLSPFAWTAGSSNSTCTWNLGDIFGAKQPEYETSLDSKTDYGEAWWHCIFRELRKGAKDVKPAEPAAMPDLPSAEELKDQDQELSGSKVCYIC